MVKTFNKVLSQRMKRLVFISSIVGLIYKVKNPDLKMIYKLNSVLHLAHSPEAMQLPYRVKSVIWRDKDLTTLGQNGKAIHIEDIQTFDLCKEDIDRLSNQVVGQTPAWLRYSCPEEMCKDLKALFTQIKKTPFSFA